MPYELAGCIGSLFAHEAAYVLVTHNTLLIGDLYAPDPVALLRRWQMRRALTNCIEEIVHES